MMAAQEPRYLRDRKCTLKLEEAKNSLKKEQSSRLRMITKLLKKPPEARTDEEKKILEESSAVIALIESRIQRTRILKERCQEVEDPSELVEEKCKVLAEIVRRSTNLVVYTGAGISTSADIPDYRGPNGVWTQLSKNGRISSARDLAFAEPTFTHMALTQLYRCNIVKHVVSQNCDGLHLRSGLPQQALSEIHGNMYIEVCTNCKRQFFRDFDVTESTALHRHKTGRKCGCCVSESSELIDTIVHFGEKGRLEWPLNWKGAQNVSEHADVILCLGSSLKILRKYKCLWPKKCGGKPQICVVNLQWTPKDSQAILKINGKCDTVMTLVMKYLGITVERYSKSNDPLLQLYTPLTPEEEGTCNKQKLFSESKSDKLISAPGWFGKGIRVKRK